MPATVRAVVRAGASSAPSPSTSSDASRPLRRIHAHPALLTRLSALTGEPVLLSQAGKDVDAALAVGTLWPDLSLDEDCVSVSPLLAANAQLQRGSSAHIERLAGPDSALVADAARLTLLLDAKTAGGRDALFEDLAREAILDLKLVTVPQFVELVFEGKSHRLVVSKASAAASSEGAPKPRVFAVNRLTKYSFKEAGANAAPAKESIEDTAVEASDAGESYSNVGGMTSQIEAIRELVEWPLTHPEYYRHFALEPPRGILLYGPPGTGKTLLASAIAASLRVPLFTVHGAELASAYHGETEARLARLFDKAKAAGPALVIIDEIDALAPRREEAGEVERRVVAALLTLMDGLGDKTGASNDRRVIVIAATNRPNAIDPALRRPGRFDRELEIGVPNAIGREAILRVHLGRMPHSLSEEDIASCAAKTHGFVGADLSALLRAAGLAALKRIASIARSSDQNALASDAARLQSDDLVHALTATRPSALREVFIEAPQVSWDDIGGQDTLKSRLRELVEWPIKRAGAFKRLGIKPQKGILLYGPPGCSKTLVARAIASGGGMNFISVKGAELFNKYVGESERAIRELFRKARQASPSIIFLDEIDAIASSRSPDGGDGVGDRILTSLLTEMDGVEELTGVVVLAATNRPQSIDPALMRPGRLDRIVYVPPPNYEARKSIFNINLRRMAVHEDIAIDELAQLTEGCSGAEIASICQDAAMKAMHEDANAQDVKHTHLLDACRSVHRRITPEMIQFYESWRDQEPQ